MAQVTSIGIVPFCIPPLPDSNDGSSMIKLTREELAYFYWKVKKVSYDSLSFGATDGGTMEGDPPEVVTHSFYGTVNNFPQEINATNALEERNLVCYQGGNSVNVESTISAYDDEFDYDFSLPWGIGGVFKDGDTYYLHPNFSFTWYNAREGITYIYEFYTSSSVIQTSSGWYCALFAESGICLRWSFLLGKIGTFTVNLGFGLKACPMYGRASWVISSNDPPPKHPTGYADIFISETETWPYNP